MGGNASVSTTFIDKEVINKNSTSIDNVNANSNQSRVVCVANAELQVGGNLNAWDGCSITVDSNNDCVSLMDVRNETEVKNDLRNDLSNAIATEIENITEQTNDGINLLQFNASADHTEINEKIHNIIDTELSFEVINDTIQEVLSESNSKFIVGGDVNCKGSSINVSSSNSTRTQLDVINGTGVDLVNSNSTINNVATKYKRKVSQKNLGLFNSQMMLYLVIAIIAVGFIAMMGKMATSGGKGPEGLDPKVMQALMAGGK